jgi:hypothetical protein
MSCSRLACGRVSVRIGRVSRLFAGIRGVRLSVGLLGSNTSLLGRKVRGEIFGVLSEQ